MKINTKWRYIKKRRKYFINECTQVGRARLTEVLRRTNRRVTQYVLPSRRRCENGSESDRQSAVGASEVPLIKQGCSSENKWRRGVIDPGGR